MEKIEIITGKIKVGKTTYISQRFKNDPNVKGILQPLIDGERFFMDLGSGEKMQITSNTENNGTFTIGKYIFNNNAFEWAKKKLSMLLLDGFDTIVIDEYGPLEFENRGLEPVVSKIVSVVSNSGSQKLIIAVRESLVNEFIQKFNLVPDETKIREIKN